MDAFERQGILVRDPPRHGRLHEADALYEEDAPIVDIVAGDPIEFRGEDGRDRTIDEAGQCERAHR